MGQPKLLSSIVYTDTTRIIEQGQLILHKINCNIHLYEDQLVSTHTTFKLENVWDVSYKSFSGSDCLLYLHTHRGVLTYRVEEDPYKFVKTFKKLKNEHY